MDASFLPTSAAVNPSLTIAAQALRGGLDIREREVSVHATRQTLSMFVPPG